jgi:hypothetical protein
MDDILKAVAFEGILVEKIRNTASVLELLESMVYNGGA